MSLGLSAGVHRAMAAHSTHQAFKGSGKTAQMTAGFAPHCETANLPARRFGRPPESAHPIFRDNPLYPNSKRQLRGAERQSNPAIVGKRRRLWIASLRSQ